MSNNPYKPGTWAYRDRIAEEERQEEMRNVMTRLELERSRQRQKEYEEHQIYDLARVNAINHRKEELMADPLIKELDTILRQPASPIKTIKVKYYLKKLEKQGHSVDELKTVFADELAKRGGKHRRSRMTKRKRRTSRIKHKRSMPRRRHRTKRKTTKRRKSRK